MKRSALSLLTLVAGPLLLPAAARAQTVGSIAGAVYDSGGTLLPGIKVVAESPTQIGGARTVYTNADGTFRIPGLIVGRFTLTVTAPKFKAQVLSGIRVGAGAETNLDIVMEIATEVEVVKVETRAKTKVNTKDAVIKESFDAEFVNDVPLLARSYQGIQAMAAGVRDTGGGNPQVRGGATFNNTTTIDGFDTTDPVSHTFGTNFAFESLSSVDVQTGAYGAENATTTGGVINVVTRSGSNKVEVESSLTYTDQNLQLFKNQFDVGVNRLVQGSFGVGGPILKDKLWYFVSAQGIYNTSTLPRDPNGVLATPASRVVTALDGFAKLTYQLSPRNKLVASTTFSPAEFNNNSQSYFVEDAAQLRQYQQTNIVNLVLESLLSDNLFLNIGASAQRILLDIGPQSCEWDPNCANVPGSLELVTGILQRNNTNLVYDPRRTVQFKGDLQWTKDTKSSGVHVVKGGFNVRVSDNPVLRSVPGDETLQTVNGANFRRTEVCANDPTQSDGVCRPGYLRTNTFGRIVNVYIGDTWRPYRYLTLKPQIAGQQGLARDARSTTVTNFLTATPHFSVIWDATHDGRTAIRGAFNQYVDTGFLALARFAGQQLSQKTCFWDEETQTYSVNCVFRGGQSGRTVGIPDPDKPPVALRAPRTWEATGGVEREVVQGISIAADYIYRRFNHQFEDTETNQIWNESGTAVRADGGYRNGKNQQIFDLGTPDASTRRYHSVTARLNKREGRMKVTGSYTWTRNRGPQNSAIDGAFLDNPKNAVYWYGSLPGEVRHHVKVFSAYQVLPWLSLGVNYEFFTGEPYNRFFYNNVYGGFIDLRAQRGYNPGANINDTSDDRELRLPDVSLLGLQGRANLRKFTKLNLDAFINVFNVLALRTTRSVVDTDTAFWGQPTSFLAPTRAVLGLSYRF